MILGRICKLALWYMAYEPIAAATFCNQLTRDLMAGKDDFVSGQPYNIVDLRGKYSYMINCSFYFFFRWILSILMMFGTVD